MSLPLSVRKAVREYVDALIGEDPVLRRLINVAIFDLYYGPTGAYEPDGDGWIYPGFEAATDAIRDSVLADVGTLYVEEDNDYVTDAEPRPGHDADGEWYDAPPYYEVSHKDVLRIYMGALADYL